MIDRKSAFRRAKSIFSKTPVSSFGIESLEDRRLLSASFGGPGPGHVVNTIEFSQAPSAVQTGLETLATTDGLTAPTSTSTQTVYLANSNGVESYTIDISGTGTMSQLTVDQNGNPVSTGPTRTTTTWATLSGTGAGSDAAAATEISAIITSLGLTAPSATATVHVLTYANGSVTYRVKAANSEGFMQNVIISVDSNGNPIGDENIPFSAIPTTIQNGLNDNAPVGATAISTTSTQNVRVRTTDGVTTYSVTFITSGTVTRVSVDSNGDLAIVPSNSTTTFSALTTPEQTELQTLATADGVADTISPTQNINVYNEANGTTIYSVSLSATSTGYDGNTYTHTIVLSIDADGNPTVPPDQGFGGNGFGFGGFSFNSFFGSFGFRFF